MFIPESYKKATKEQKDKVCNGTGPALWKGKVVFTNYVWGLNIKECSDIHDWMYAEGGVEKDKIYADTTYKENLMWVISKNPSNWLINTLRRNTADLYFFFVCRFGHNFFKYRNE